MNAKHSQMASSHSSTRYLIIAKIQLERCVPGLPRNLIPLQWILNRLLKNVMLKFSGFIAFLRMCKDNLVLF